VVEEEGEKSVSLVVEVGLRGPCLNLCKMVLHVDAVEIGEDEVVGLAGFLLLLPGLCWTPDSDDESDADADAEAEEDDDDDDDDDDDYDGNSCEDPESDPWWCWCWDFPLPAFDEALHLFLMGWWFFTLPALVVVQLPHLWNLLLLLPKVHAIQFCHFHHHKTKPKETKLN